MQYMFKSSNKHSINKTILILFFRGQHGQEAKFWAAPVVSISMQQYAVIAMTTTVGRKMAVRGGVTKMFYLTLSNLKIPKSTNIGHQV